MSFPKRDPSQRTCSHSHDRENVFGEETQGVCHTSADWFITRNNPPTVYKVPLGNDLNAGNPSVAQAGIPTALTNLGYNHVGDPDCMNGFVFVPIEVITASGGVLPRPGAIAVYRASDLSFVNWDELYVNSDNHGGWVALDPSNGVDLWSSSAALNGTGTQGLFKYAIDWNALLPGGGFIFWGGAGPAPHPMLNRLGQQLAIVDMQGGVFDTLGTALYLTNSGRASADGHGIFAFLKSGFYLGQTGNAYGPFNYQTSGGSDMEEEGLDFFPTSPGLTPNISGELHAVLLNNDTFDSDNWYFKHFRRFQ